MFGAHLSVRGLGLRERTQQRGYPSTILSGRNSNKSPLAMYRGSLSCLRVRPRYRVTLRNVAGEKYVDRGPGKSRRPASFCARIRSIPIRVDLPAVLCGSVPRCTPSASLWLPALPPTPPRPRHPTPAQKKGKHERNPTVACSTVGKNTSRSRRVRKTALGTLKSDTYYCGKGKRPSSAKTRRNFSA